MISATRATKASTRADVSRLRASLQGAKLALGVDRLDYSKGLANRMRAFDRMLELEPQSSAMCRCCRSRFRPAATSAPIAS